LNPYGRHVPRFRFIALAVVLLGLAAAAPAQGASMVFIKNNNVHMSRPDGSRQVRITRDGSRRFPYFSPSIADNGTIVALKSVFLHSFRPNGRRIVKPLQWAINPTPSLSTEPVNVDLSPNGRIAATQNLVYSTYYDPRRSSSRPTVAAQFIDFFDFRRNPPKEIGQTDSFYDYNIPSWIDSQTVLSASYGIYNAQVFTNRVGRTTRGVEFYRDPGRDPQTGTNSFALADAEMTRARDKFAVVRRPIRGPGFGDVSVGTIQIYRAGNPSATSTPLCTIGPGRRISQEADPSWSHDGRTLLWWEVGRGIFSTPVTSAPGCGISPKRIVSGAISPDLSRANVPR
jgi:hypothetical protein